jgi:hypothetical protein
VDEEFLCYVPLLGQQSQLGWDMIVIWWDVGQMLAKWVLTLKRGPGRWGIRV